MVRSAPHRDFGWIVKISRKKDGGGNVSQAHPRQALLVKKIPAFLCSVRFHQQNNLSMISINVSRNQLSSFQEERKRDHTLKGSVSRDYTPRSRKNWHLPLQRIVGGFLRAFLPVGPFRARFFHCFRIDDLFTAPVTHQDQGLRACNSQAGQKEPRPVPLFMPSPWPLCGPGKFSVPCRIQLQYSSLMVFPPLFWFTAWAVKPLLRKAG